MNESDFGNGACFTPAKEASTAKTLASYAGAASKRPKSNFDRSKTTTALKLRRVSQYF